MSGAAARTAATWSGKSAWQIRADAPLACPQIGDLVRRLAEVRRNPHGAQAEAGEHRLEHLVAVLGLHQNAVAFRDAVGGERGRHGVHAPVDLGPGPSRVAPGERNLPAIAAGRLPDEMGEVHDPPGNRGDAPLRIRVGAGHFCRSRIET